MIDGKLIEEKRYNKRALDLLKQGPLGPSKHGSNSIHFALRSPYIYYEKKIRQLIRPCHKVLEIGSGTGLHTYSLLKTGAHITATDISSNALKVVEMNLQELRGGGELKTLLADMELLPFENQSFDVVTSAGSLSYGEAQKVDQEILRVLKPTGFFICVDSLNNNPIYKLNRYLHYLRGLRSKMTLTNMPSLKRISSISKKYKEIEVKYFGSISFLMPLLSKFLTDNTVNNLSKNIDKIIKVRKSAFKFVMVVKK